MDNKLIGSEKNILFYSDEEGNPKVEVLLENEDVWLNAEAISTLFNIDRSGIVRHINNIYKDEELDENSTCAKIAHMGNDGKQTYNTKYYNLDMIISIGFRVNPKTNRNNHIQIIIFCIINLFTVITHMCNFCTCGIFI